MARELWIFFFCASDMEWYGWLLLKYTSQVLRLLASKVIWRKRTIKDSERPCNKLFNKGCFIVVRKKLRKLCMFWLVEIFLSFQIGSLEKNGRAKTGLLNCIAGAWFYFVLFFSSLTAQTVLTLGASRAANLSMCRRTTDTCNHSHSPISINNNDNKDICIFNIILKPGQSLFDN